MPRSPLDNSSEELALDLLYMLKQVGSQSAAAALSRATSHPSAAVRVGALRLLAESSPIGTIAPRLKTALGDRDPRASRGARARGGVSARRL